MRTRAVVPRLGGGEVGESVQGHIVRGVVGGPDRDEPVRVGLRGAEDFAAFICVEPLTVREASIELRPRRAAFGRERHVRHRMCCSSSVRQ